MKKTLGLSARKIITMLVKGEHTQYCQTKHLPANTCLCLSFESKQYLERLSVRPRKVSLRRQKIHFLGYACGAKSIINTSSNPNDISCKHCTKALVKKNLVVNSIVSATVIPPTLTTLVQCNNNVASDAN